MSQDTTTISIRDDQKDELEAMKTHERESYKAVLDRLLEDDTAEPTEPVPIEEVVGREVLIDELSNIEAAVKENTDKVEKTKSLVEDLGASR